MDYIETYEQSDIAYVANFTLDGNTEVRLVVDYEGNGEVEPNGPIRSDEFYNLKELVRDKVFNIFPDLEDFVYEFDENADIQ